MIFFFKSFLHVACERMVKTRTLSLLVSVSLRPVDSQYLRDWGFEEQLGMSES